MPEAELKYFFSYTSKDREFVIRLAKELRAEGANLWIDQLDILAGQHWDRTVEEALKSCKGMIAVLSPDSVASANVMDEVSYALDKGKLVVPVLIRSCEIPLRLGRLHYADFTADYDAGFSHLLRALGIERPVRPSQSTPGKEPVVRDSAAPARAKPTEPLVRKEQAAQQGEEPSLPAVREPTPNAPDDPKPAGRETERAPSKSKTVKMLAAICIVALIAIILTAIFGGGNGDGQNVDEPHEEPTPAPNRPEERGSKHPEAGNVVTNSIGMKLVYIPAGSFMMGSSDSAAQLARDYGGDEEDFAREFPQHEVRISEGFWMGQTEVTQGQYKSVMKAGPWSGREKVQENANNPAVYVAWEDANDFCRKLSEQEGKTYRLPTEAEWEYACRAGTTTRFSFGDDDSSLDDHAWFFDNALKVGEEYAHPVGQKKSNPWGLYDMHGNAWEWCSDCFGEDYYSNSPSLDPTGPSSGEARCVRGGSWDSTENVLRCSCRACLLPGVRYYYFGFRVVRSQ